MKNLALLLLIVVSALHMHSCTCPASEEPPVTFLFKFEDSQTGENLLNNETFKPVLLKIEDAASDNEQYYYEVISSTNDDILRIGLRREESQVLDLKFYHDDVYLFDFHVEAELIEQRCNDYLKINEETVSGIEYRLDSLSKVYAILVE